MRPFGAWFGRLAMAGACLLGAGCGGGDVPDPYSDSHAANNDPPKRGPAPRGEAEPEPDAKPDAGALASNTPVPEAPKTEPSAPKTGPDERSKPEEKSSPSPRNDAPAANDTSKPPGDSGSSTPATPPTPQVAPAPGGNGSSPAPNGPSPRSPSQNAPGPNNYPSPSPSPTPAPAPGGGGASPTPPATPPGGSGSPDPKSPNDANNPGPGANRDDRGGSPGGGSAPGNMTISPVNPPGGRGPRAPGAAPGAPGGSGSGGAAGPSGFGAMSGDAPGGGGPSGAGGPGGGQADLMQGTKAFNYPATAVKAFLAALEAKNKDRLAQCTALHAKVEAAEKHRKIFAAIEDGSISDDELDEMAKTLKGYQVSGILEAKSTGRIGILISKMDGRDRLQRTVMTRKEKEGWKVMDVDSALEFKFIQMPVRGGRGRGRR